MQLPEYITKAEVQRVCAELGIRDWTTLTKPEVTPDEAERIGLVSRVVPADRLMEEALALARSIAAHSAFGVWMTKRGAWANVEAGSLQAALELENRTQILTRTTGELGAAAAARVGRARR